MGTGVCAFALYGGGLLAASGVGANIPSVPFSHYIYFGLFFLLGYFIYGTIYALVGSMVTTAQEGGQLAVPIILILVVSFYLFYPVSRSPDSTFSFWVSMIPFSAPVAMLVRIVTQTPPFWQIALSLLIGLGSVLAIMWVAARIYRVGMLMYGKRASITGSVALGQASMIEVEKKFRLTKRQRDAVLKRLPEIGASLEGEEFEENTLYRGEPLQGIVCCA